MSDTARNKSVAQLALWSIPVGIAIMAVKFVAWKLTGSVAKAEYFSAVAEGVLIVLAALLILRQAVPSLIAPEAIDAPYLGLAITGVVALANAAWASLLIRRGREHQSVALSADGAHLMTDVFTSISIIVGLLLAVVTGWAILDPILAILVALNILRTGWKMIRASVDVLMDGAVDPSEADQIEGAILENAKGANEIHDVRIRRAGPALFIEFHLVVDGEMNVTDSHAICDRIEAALETLAPSAHVTIHVEPAFKSEKGARPVLR